MSYRRKLAIVAPMMCIAPALFFSRCNDGGQSPPNPSLYLHCLTLDAGGLGTITLTPPGEDFGSSVNAIDYVEGTVVTIDISPNSGYAFVRIDWEDASTTTDNPSQVTMNDDKVGSIVFVAL